MRSIEDKGCYYRGSVEEISSSGGISFEFFKGNGANNCASSHRRTGLGKPAPSKWDDAQKWLVGLSRSRAKSQSETTPRNSNADDVRLIAAPLGRQKDQDYLISERERAAPQGQTKMADGRDESIRRIDRPASEISSTSVLVRSICLRDMETEMTPIASQEPSRTATPIRAMTPAATSPISSGSSTPLKGYQVGPISTQGIGETKQESRIHNESNNSDQARKQNTLETRAMAWDEAERAKYMARYKREEVKIQAWEDHEKRKAETEMTKVEVKAERLKARAKERCANKLAATTRIAEEKRANAKSKLNEKAIRISERADYIRRTGHLHSSFSFKLPSLCSVLVALLLGIWTSVSNINIYLIFVCLF